MTLIEVVAGIALLATLLVSILVAFNAHASQVRTSQDRLSAIAMADRLLSDWTSNNKFPAVGDQKSIPGSDGLRWRIVRTKNSVVPELGAQIVRLEVFKSAGELPERILASVDVVIQGSPVLQATPE